MGEGEEFSQGIRELHEVAAIGKGAQGGADQFLIVIPGLAHKGKHLCPVARTVIFIGRGGEGLGKAGGEGVAGFGGHEPCEASKIALTTFP